VRLIATCIVVIGALALVGAARGSASLSGTTWTGVVGLTQVSVSFDDGNQHTSGQFGDGNYSIDDNQVSLHPSGQSPTRVFAVDGSVMQGTIDGWPCTLTKQ
jgi:hypothetical protein